MLDSLFVENQQVNRWPRRMEKAEIESTGQSRRSINECGKAECQSVNMVKTLLGPYCL